MSRGNLVGLQLASQLSAAKNQCLPACLHVCHSLPFPTGLFTILELQDQETGEVYVDQKRRATYLEASILL